MAYIHGQKRPTISVVIPAYNEEERLAATLVETSLFFSSKPYITEIIVVNDGSSDNTTKTVMNVFNARDQKKIHNIRPYLKHHTKNMGKGAAVATGIKAASGLHVLFIDADGATPISEFDKLYRQIGMYPIVIGSRDVGDEDRTYQKNIRKLIGRISKILTKILFNLPVTDTQCGFKLFENSVAKNLVDEQITKRFGFDVEYLARAHKSGLAIKEIGIRWHDKANGKVHPIKDSWKTLVELIRLRKNI